MQVKGDRWPHTRTAQVYNAAEPTGTTPIALCRFRAALIALALLAILAVIALV